MFYLADWKEDFFSLLYSHVLDVTENNFQDAILIFPTHRAKQICLEMFKQRAEINLQSKDKKENSSALTKDLNTLAYNASFLPEMLTFEEWLKSCQMFWLDEEELAAKQIDSLESIVILYEIVKKMAKSRTKKSEKAFFSTMLGSEERQKASFFHKPLQSFAYFYSYGEFLHAIIQECFEENSMLLSLKTSSMQENTAFSNLAEIAEVEAFSSYLLTNLRAITQNYIAELKKQKKTTKTYSKFVLAQKIKEIQQNESKDLVHFYKEKKIIFSGLDRLAKTEELFTKYFVELAKKDALKNMKELSLSFVFCSDPLLASDMDKAHWSCAHYVSWAKRWKENYILLDTTSDTTCLEKNKSKSTTKKSIEIKNEYNNSLLSFAKERQDFHFYKAFDTHSQFQNLKIEKKTVNERIACVLNTEDSLLPLLYSLYPDYAKDEELNVTMGYSLKHSKIVQLLHILYELKNNKREYFIGNNKSYLIKSAHLAEFLSFPYFAEKIQNASHEVIKQKKAFIDPLICFKGQEEILQLIKDVLDAFLSLDRLGKTVEFIYSLSKNIKGQIHTNSFEQVVLLRLENIAKNWQEKEYIDLEMDFELCFNFLLKEIENEHLAFSHHSDSALQIMGLFETKLLSFDTVYIFDANEEFLPRKALENPLLPEKLRPVLALLSSHEKELYYAHTWYRLIANAKKIHISWQEASAKGLLETKKELSSYVEEIIWEVEQKNKALLDEKSKEFSQASCPIGLKEHEHLVQTSPIIKQAISEMLEYGISASRLDTFISCPLRFFYENVCKFEAMKMYEEGEDNAVLGNFVHDFMQELYEEGNTVNKSQLIKIFNKKIKKFDELLEEHEMHDNFPPESLLLLKHSFNYRMQKYIEKQADETFVVGIEKELKAQVCNNAHIMGRIDRIDKRTKEDGTEEILVLDYKSFSVTNKLVNEKFWMLEDFFDELQACVKKFDEIKAKELLEKLYSQSQSIQLFVYLFLTYRNGYRPTNAAYVDLYESCEEKKIIFVNNDEKDIIEKKIPLILNFLVTYLQEITCFSANRHSKCDWCSFKKYCI